MDASQDRMEKVNEKTWEEMRKDFRAALSSVARISLEGRGPALEAELADLSFGGVRVRFPGSADLPDMIPGASCKVRVRIREKEETFPGKVVWASSGADDSVEAGIQFEGLSVDDKSDLVALFMWERYRRQHGQGPE